MTSTASGESTSAPPRARRKPHGLLAVAATAVITAAALLAGCTPSGGSPTTTASTTTTTMPAGWATCPTPGAGQVRVATVVEGGGLSGFTQPEVVCVVVNQGANGLAALNARAARLGVPANRLNGSGLLCAIGGLPAAPACGESGPSGPEYWSYWAPNGSGGWTYSTVGPASRIMQEGSVEGWRWVPGGTSAAPVHTSAFNSLVTI